MKKRTLAGLLGPSVLAAIFTGCASSGVKNPSGIGVTEMRADEKGFVAGTGGESQDLVAATDKMGRSFLATPQVRNAHKPPVVVLDPGISDYVLYSFELVDARTSAIVWQDFAEIKKQGLEDAAYR